MKTEKKTPKKEKTPAAKKTTKKVSPKEKSTKKAEKKAGKLSPTKVKSEVTPTKVKAEKWPNTSTTSVGQDEPSTSDEKVKKEWTPSPAKATPPRPMNPFFMSTKQAKEQAAGQAGPDGSDYSPAKANYHPIKDAFWKHGEK